MKTSQKYYRIEIIQILVICGIMARRQRKRRSMDKTLCETNRLMDTTDYNASSLSNSPTIFLMSCVNVGEIFPIF